MFGPRREVSIFPTDLAYSATETNMGVDHGLGGKDTESSKKKRAKRAERIKASAESRMKVVKGAKEVVWDEESRVDYLTGFKKRKNERRKFGLAMQVMKEAKAKKEVLKEKRAQVIKANKKEQDKLKELQGKGSDDSSSEEEDESNDEGDKERKGKKGEEVVFNDEETTSMFGGSVSVVVNEDMDNAEEESDEKDTNSMEWKRAKERLEKKRERMNGKPLTRLERAMKKVVAKGGMLKKKKPKPKSGGKEEDSKFSRNKKKSESSSAGKALLRKAQGAGIVGGFKGKGKGHRK